MRKTLTVLAFSVSLTSPAFATPTVTVGAWAAAVGPQIVIPINVSGGDPVAGVTFIAEISQGGIFPASGSPSFASIDMTTGTIFSSNQNPPAAQFSIRTGNTMLTNVAANGGPTYTPTSGPAVKVKESFFTASGTVNANGLLATLVINTVGMTGGTWDLRVVGMVTGAGGGANSSFTGDSGPGIWSNGTITDASDPPPGPEPSTFVLALCGAVGLRVVLRRNSQISRAHAATPD